MAVAEYCGNCDKRTLRSVGPCPECTPENVESQTTDTQQLKAEIAAFIETLEFAQTENGAITIDISLVLKRFRQLSAV